MFLEYVKGGEQNRTLDRLFVFEEKMFLKLILKLAMLTLNRNKKVRTTVKINFVALVQVGGF